MKKEINVFDYANLISKELGKGGILLTTKNGSKVNSMTIGWGMVGRIWELPAFIAFVRTGRFTRGQLDASGEFTINVPYGDFDKKILGYCGSRSGRNTDKIADLKLSLVESDIISAPGIKELPLTLECKVLYSQLQDKNSIPDDILSSMYPEGVDSFVTGANQDPHIAYYGQILKSYIID